MLSRFFPRACVPDESPDPFFEFFLQSSTCLSNLVFLEGFSIRALDRDIGGFGG